MPRNDDGEYELILGNRQIMSVFFMVAILVGLFFTMGYIVGRNSSAGTGEVATVPSVEQSPASTATAPSARDLEPAPSQRAVETAPQQSDERTPVVAKEISTDSTKPAAKRTSVTAQPVAGKAYLQLAATSEHEAGVLVDVLRKKGFKSLFSEIDEKRGTFRVLVGPVDEGAANKTRADLQDAGFPGNAAIRRTF